MGWTDWLAELVISNMADMNFKAGKGQARGSSWNAIVSRPAWRGHARCGREAPSGYRSCWPVTTTKSGLTRPFADRATRQWRTPLLVWTRLARFTSLLWVFGTDDTSDSTRNQWQVSPRCNCKIT